MLINIYFILYAIIFIKIYSIPNYKIKNVDYLWYKKTYSFQESNNNHRSLKIISTVGIKDKIKIRCMYTEINFQNR